MNKSDISSQRHAIASFQMNPSFLTIMISTNLSACFCFSSFFFLELWMYFVYLLYCVYVCCFVRAPVNFYFFNSFFLFFFLFIDHRFDCYCCYWFSLYEYIVSSLVNLIYCVFVLTFIFAQSFSSYIYTFTKLYFEQHAHTLNHTK